ncbi:MAG: MotA/TolQ/ExbB proton channel family protein [bacterium]
MSSLAQYGFVFWIIVILGIDSFVTFLTRMLQLRRAQIDYADFIKGICNVLKDGSVGAAIMICEETPGPVAAVVLTAIRHRHADSTALREAVDNAGRAEISRMERRQAAIAITCQIAPLLGLLGTLFGVLKIVHAAHAQSPLVQSVDLTTGLMQALVSTIAGLLVAIPCHAMYAILMVRIERIVIDMEAAAAEIVAYLTSNASSLTPRATHEEE